MESRLSAQEAYGEAEAMVTLNPAFVVKVAARSAFRFVRGFAEMKVVIEIFEGPEKGRRLEYSAEFPKKNEKKTRELGASRGAPVRDPIMIVLDDEPIPILERRPDLGKALAGVVDRAVKKDKTLRFQTAGEMREALRSALRGA